MILAFDFNAEARALPHVRAAINEALEASRRIEKGVETAREIARLGVALRAIEASVFENCGRPRLLEGRPAVDAINALPRLGTVRLPFTLDGEPSLFIAAVPFAPCEDTGPMRPLRRPRNIITSGPQVARGQSKIIHQIRAARDGGGDISLGNSRHIEITLALREFLRTAASEPPFDIRFVYKDGSVGSPIPLRRHEPKAEMPEYKQELALGLSSCRHFDTDPLVDMYLIRNAALSRRDDPTFSDQEAYTYEKACKVIDEFAGSEGLHIQLYHSGLEPACVGFYRAVIDALLAKRPLMVTPIYSPRGGKQHDAWW